MKNILTAAPEEAAGAGPPFGEALRGWRDRRGLSQLELGLQAGVSSRHISFLETGRARPSLEMVLRLAVALDLPLRERNDLLLGAGFAPRYPERPLEGDELAGARRALQFILDMHEPYPAFVLDRTWQLVMWNRTQAYMLRDLHGPGGAPSDLNALDMVLAPGPMRESFVNWEEVARAVLRRLRRQAARVGSGDALHRTWTRIRSMPGVEDLLLEEAADRPPPVLVPMRMREGDRVLAWFSTLATFGAAGDVTLDELVVESFFPGDEATRAYVEEAARRAGARPRPAEATPAEAPAAGSAAESEMLDGKAERNAARKKQLRRAAARAVKAGRKARGRHRDRARAARRRR